MEKTDDSDDSFDNESEDDNEAEDKKLNYKEYTISKNEYTDTEKREVYIVAMKNLCHKLK